MRPRILTGDRPTGQLHIGHYFGSLQERVTLQHEFDTFILVADVQALTDNFEQPQKVKANVFEVVLDNLAVGIEPNLATFVIQSMIPEIAELTVFYSNLVTIARLQQNPTVKSEIQQKRELFKHSVSYGFLGYPVSQAADITAFKAQLVPVGDDQLPQLEQTRDIVRKFNRLYGDTLVEPQGKYSAFPRVKGLDGKAKMSKSLNNAIFLADKPELIKEKVKQAVTDPQKIRLKDAGNPDRCSVF
jgi:tryptophanyl-tRNA synthetase